MATTESNQISQLKPGSPKRPREVTEFHTPQGRYPCGNMARSSLHERNHPRPQQPHSPIDDHSSTLFPATSRLSV